MEIPQELIKAIELYDNFLILSHMEPDGDCISSSLALAYFLQSLGKSYKLISPGPFQRVEIQYAEQYFSAELKKEDFHDKTLAVVLDCSSLDRLSDLQYEITQIPIAVIDHHAEGTPFGDIRFIDENAASTSYLIQILIEEMRGPVTKKEAEELFFGLCTDTGFFRHLEEQSSRMFSAAARLLDAGASPKKTHTQMYGGRSLESRILLGKLLSRIEYDVSRKIFISYESLKDHETIGKEHRDSDILYQLMQGIENCEAIALIREEAPGEFSVGLRSNHNINVAEIARDLGGGGHKKAAGLLYKGSYEDIKQALWKKLTLALENL